jgi:hypothetical protein
VRPVEVYAAQGVGGVKLSAMIGAGRERAGMVHLVAVVCPVMLPPTCQLSIGKIWNGSNRTAGTRVHFYAAELCSKKVVSFQCSNFAA